MFLVVNFLHRNNCPLYTRLTLQLPRLISSHFISSKTIILFCIFSFQSIKKKDRTCSHCIKKNKNTNNMANASPWSFNSLLVATALSPLASVVHTHLLASSRLQPDFQLPQCYGNCFGKSYSIILTAKNIGYFSNLLSLDHCWWLSPLWNSP